tara:strand:- start:7936 stop:9285 length:1350 start_codon:yes stop_codon:yes gene_type:complete
MISSSIKSIKYAINSIYDNYNITHIDSIIVGGGIVGTSLAYHLSSKSNHSIILIDKNNIGSGATCLSAGTIYSPYKELPKIDNINSEHNIKDYLSIGTIEIIKYIDKQISCDFMQPGSITMGSVRTKSYLSNIVNNGKKMGQDIKLHQGGLYAPNSVQLNPRKTVDAFTKLAEINGVKILENTFIQKVFLEKGMYNITLNNNDRYRCKNLILANGIGVNQVSNKIGIHVPIIPVKGIIWNIEIPSQSSILNHIIFSSNSSYTWNMYPTLDLIKQIPNHCTHDVYGKKINHNFINLNRFMESVLYNNELDIEHFYGKQYQDDNGNLNIMFGFNRQVALHENDYNIDEKQVKECFNKIKNIFPSIENKTVDNYWCGLMPFSINDKPIVGNFSCFGHPNVWIANGLGAHGIAIGPMTTKILSDMILGISNNNEKCLSEIFNVNSCRMIDYLN